MDIKKVSESIYYGNLREAALKIKPEIRQEILDYLRQNGGSAISLAGKFSVDVEGISGLIAFNIIKKDGCMRLSDKDLVGDTVESQGPWYD